MMIKLNNMCEFHGTPIPVSRDDFELLNGNDKKYSDYGEFMSSLAMDHYIMRKDLQSLRYFWNGDTVQRNLGNWAFSAKKRMKSFYKTYTVFEDLIFWIDSTGDIYCSSDVKKIRAVLRRKLYRRRAFRVPFSEEGKGFRENIYNDLITRRLT